MDTFTVQSIYEKGILRPRKKLNLPENSLVKVRVKVAPTLDKKAGFASLIGIWEGKNLDLDASLARVRSKSKTKINKLAKAFK